MSRSGFLDFLEFAAARSSADVEGQLTPADYEEIAAHHYIGEWIFSGPPFVATPWDDDGYLRFLAETGESPSLIKIARRFRQLVPDFLDQCAAQLLGLRPTAIGFTTTFGQTIASLAVSLRLKHAAPTVQIVFGGANCEGDMGRALFSAFSCIDVVVQGEGERAAVEVFSSILAGQPVMNQTGIISRAAARAAAREPTSPPVPLDDLPIPDFREYFQRMAASPLAPALRVGLSLPVETSRGCWWGAKAHCTFCGLNGTAMAFRSKSASRAEIELVELAKRHRVLNFTAVDNILDLNYIDTVFPALRARRLDLDIFYETKANLTKLQLEQLKDGGVNSIQPGLESLSTPILQNIRKGTSAIQNIRLLKWCAELDIHVHWNLIYGFPGEDPSEYSRMARLIPIFSHLEPPAMTPLGIERFSPYHSDPLRYGLKITGPHQFYKFAYPCDDETLLNLAYAFEYEYADDRKPRDYARPLMEAVELWRKTHEAAAGRLTLSYRRGPDFIEITDGRPGSFRGTVVLDEREAAIYEACDRGASVNQVCRRLQARGPRFVCDAGNVRAFLDDVAGEHLVYEENGVYLSLACAPPSHSRGPVQLVPD